MYRFAIYQRGVWHHKILVEALGGWEVAQEIDEELGGLHGLCGLQGSGSSFDVISSFIARQCDRG